MIRTLDSRRSTQSPQRVSLRTLLEARASKRSRQGGILILVAFLLVFLLIFSAMIINLSHMQLVDTEMRSATDAAARAAAEALARGETITEARAEAKRIAGENIVAGNGLVLSDSDIVFGFADSPESGRATFVQGSSETNAVRILGRRMDDAAGGSVSMLFQGFLTDTEFTSARTATARIQERDFCLVLDRSGSMAALDGGLSPISGLRITRLAALQIACGDFVNVLRDTIGREKLAVASYSTTSSRDVSLGFDYSPTESFVRDLPASGMTNIGMGIDDGVRLLMDPATHRSIARPILVVMTDGQHNQNRDPEAAAREAMANHPNLLIHTVTFSTGADQARMRRVAAIGLGRHHHANDLTQLRAVFDEIARTAGTSLIE